MRLTPRRRREVAGSNGELLSVVAKCSRATGRVLSTISARPTTGARRIADLQTALVEGSFLAGNASSTRSPEAVFGKPGACHQGRLTGSAANSHCRPSRNSRPGLGQGLQPGRDRPLAAPSRSAARDPKPYDRSAISPLPSRRSSSRADRAAGAIRKQLLARLPQRSQDLSLELFIVDCSGKHHGADVLRHECPGVL
jgi:hypothetical protein